MAKRTFLEWIQYTNSPHTNDWSRDWDIEFGRDVERVVERLMGLGVCIEYVRFKD